jgi:hypothetical protein
VGEIYSSFIYWLLFFQALILPAIVLYFYTLGRTRSSYGVTFILVTAVFQALLAVYEAVSIIVFFVEFGACNRLYCYGTGGASGTIGVRTTSYNILLGMT